MGVGVGVGGWGLKLMQPSKQIVPHRLLNYHYFHGCSEILFFLFFLLFLLTEFQAKLDLVFSQSHCLCMNLQLFA